MKHLFLLLLLSLSVAAGAQTKADYEKAMGRFMKFYNGKKGDSIVNMFAAKYRNDVKYLWTTKEITTLHEKYGKIVSCKFARLQPENENAAAFEVVYSRIEKNGINMLLNKSGNVESFMLLTSEPKPKKRN